MEIQLIDINDSQRIASNKKTSHNINNPLPKSPSPKPKPLMSPKKLAKLVSDEQKEQNYEIHQESQQQQQQPQFYQSKKKNKKANKDLERNVAYPQATIRQYLNQKRTTQNKICHVLFCLYMIVVLMLAGVGFFYGSYSYVGKFISDTVEFVDRVTPCTKYVSQNASTCIADCNDGILYLDKVCLTQPPFNPSFSEALNKQISIFTMKDCLVQIVYGSFISLVISSLCFIFLICFAKLIYLYIACTFILLLGFAFYLLKSVSDQLNALTVQNAFSGFTLTSDSIFYQEMASMLPLAYILMAMYLVVFPFVLFSLGKIKSAVRIVSRLSKYFSKTSSVSLFTFLVIYLTWGLIMLEIFLIINMFTAGEPEVESGSFMFVFKKVSLSHPAVLVIHFFGIYWFFGTVISWHKYFTSNAMCLWYFEDGQNMYPVQRGLKRSWYSLGTAAIDSLLLPLEWLHHLIYSATKPSESETQTTTADDDFTFYFCITSIRQCLNSIYCKVNCHSSSSAPLTNYSYQQACEISAVTFSHHNHRFFNIGKTLSVLMTTFTCLLWLVVCYTIIYVEVYAQTSPPRITSLTLPMISVFLSSLVVGSMFSNMYSSAADCLIFCYLLEKKKNVANTKNEVKDILEQLYNDDELGNEEAVEMFEYEDD